MPNMFDDDDTLVDETKVLPDIGKYELDDPHDEFPADEATEAELPIEEQKALRVLEACDCFVEALLMISEAAGVDDPDDFQRACNVIARHHRIACNALLLYGFQPRRLSID